MRARWTMLGLGCAALAGAAEPATSPPEKSAPTATVGADTITAAKRDLETIKALRGPTAEAGKAESLRLAVPEMPGATPSSGFPSATTLPKGAKGGANANWLVDAMAKKGERVNGDKNLTTPGQGGTTDERDGETENPFAAAKLRRDAERDPTVHDDKSKTDAVTNPLTAFMAGWMTPQDLKLLQPGGAPGTPGRGASERAGSFLPEGVGSSPGGDRSLSGKTAGAATGNAPKENPFLAALGPATPTPSSAAASIVVASPPPALTRAHGTLTPLPPAAPATAPGAPPAFVKPADDAKYFKPLKRF